jgi:hypothetical protein
MEQEMRSAARPWIKPLARAGFVTKGLVYLLVGGLALLSTVGHGGQVAGKQEAVRSIGEHPFGELLLIASGSGLFAYALFCVLRAWLNLDHKSGIKGVAKRGAALVSALVYGALALTVFQLALGQPAADGGARTWVARVMAAPFGRVMIGMAALLIVANGLLQLYRALKARFLDELETHEMSARTRSIVTAIGRMGLTARGVVFAIVGYYLLKAALESSPRQSRDLGGALREIANQSHGQVGLALIAAGLAAYGFHMLVSARYARLAL